MMHDTFFLSIAAVHYLDLLSVALITLIAGRWEKRLGRQRG
jgi:hypothetical protein